ncbi:MAG: AAA domain-containing protein, partial [Terriglobia bacterium]
LVTYLRNGGDNLQLYLYIGDLRTGSYFYPVCYIPIEFSMDESHKTFQLEFQPNLYVHKRALDFVAQELESNAAIRSLVALDGRMTRVSDNESFLIAMEPIFARIENAFDLNGNVVLDAASSTEAKSSSVRLSNTLHFAVFDRSDESVLNDYEALLRALQTDREATAELFEDVIRGFIEENPVYAGKEIQDEWDRTPVTERLVAASPIPLNDEQRKLLNALRNGHSRFLIVQGPPGCGKSHSITAIAFDSILEGKSILILSDKAEALDVVEDKLRETLAQIRGSSDFPDPILRLGKATNNFHKLVAADSVQRIRLHHQAGKSQNTLIEQEILDTETRLKQGIIQTVQAFSAISLKEIEELHAIELRMDARVPGLAEALRHPEGDAHLSRLAEMMQGLGDLQPGYTFFTQRFRKGPLRLLQATVRAYAVVTLVPSLHKKKQLLATFTYLGHTHVGLLNSIILDYQALRLPVLGFLFRGRAVRELNARVGGLLPCPNTADLHRKLPELRQILEALVLIQSTVDDQGLSPDVVAAAYRLLLKDAVEVNESIKLRRILDLVSLVLGTRSALLEQMAVDGRSFRNAGELLAFIVETA